MKKIERTEEMINQRKTLPRQKEIEMVEDADSSIDERDVIKANTVNSFIKVCLCVDMDLRVQS